MSDDSPIFERQVIRPTECLREGWQLIRDNYWLYFGIVVVGILVASLGPMGVLMGPAMCGIYFCLMRREQGEPVKFDMLFRGFDYFIQSLIATLLMMIPILLIVIPGYLILFVVMFATLPQQPQAQGAPPPDAASVMPMIIAFSAFGLLVFVVSIVVQTLFLFTYPLIVERKLSGVEALKLSFRAVKANFGGVVGLVLLTMLLSMLGALACYVGLFFLMPIHYAANFIAYRRVFPLTDSAEPAGESLSLE